MKKTINDIFRLNSELWQWSLPQSLEWQFHHPSQNIAAPESGEPVIIRVRESQVRVIATQLIMQLEDVILRRVISPSKRRKYSYKFGGISIMEDTVLKFTDVRISKDKSHPKMHMNVRIFENNPPKPAEYESFIINPKIRKIENNIYYCHLKRDDICWEIAHYQPTEWGEGTNPFRKNEESIHLGYNISGNLKSAKIEPAGSWNDYRRGLSSTKIRLKYLNSEGSQPVEINSHVYIDNILTSEDFQEKVVYNFETLESQLIWGPGPKSAVVTRWDESMQIFNYQYKDDYLSQIEIVDTDTLIKEKYFIEYTILDKGLINLREFQYST